MQREKARALDRHRQLALVARLGAGDARRHDLAVFLDEVLQDLDVLVVDLLDAFGGEAAELLALEQVVAALALLCLPSSLPEPFPWGRGMSVSFQSGFSSFEFVDVQGDGDAGAVAAGEESLAAQFSSSAISWPAQFAGSPNATAASSHSTFRSPPASAWIDACPSMQSSAGMPAGV